MKRPAEAHTPVLGSKRRCAIYGRVSTSEQTDGAYNSLHAQYDSCAAFVASQRREGWVLMPDRYEDGGVSGGTLERPALQRLLQDIEAGRIDIVVSYKLDRLSRSLTDFVKLMEVFDAHNATFVSITQAFNTTTSMGRLTLNILLSFAQFEREIISERIRDKFAASRARGKWMGGKPPAGYDVLDRKLVVNEAEAKRVLRVFEVFADTGSGIATVRQLQADGITTRSGRPLDKGVVYKQLNNRTYVGETAHKGNIYPGEHHGIVPRGLWDRVHAILRESPRTRANQNRMQSPALLRGLIFGTDGRAMSPTHTMRRGRQYRYYVSQTVLKGDAPENTAMVRRIAAAEIERTVMAQVQALIRQPEIIVGTWLAARAEIPELTEEETRSALHSLEPMWAELFPAEQARIVQSLVERVVIGPHGADIRLRIEGLAERVNDFDTPGFVI